MIVGVYGVGYLIAARDPARHWPIVLVGLLGKILGPIGFIGAVIQGQLPLAFGWTILTNDLVWWAPFGAALYHAFSAAQDGGRECVELSRADALRRPQTTEGRSIAELSSDRRVLLVFLRHAGCTFCQETLADLAEQRAAIEANGVCLAIVQMGNHEQGAELLGSFGLGDVPRLDDPGRSIYRAFGLKRGTVGQLFGPRVWLRGLVAALHGHRIGPCVGDGLQMPGVFLVEHAQVIRAIRHGNASFRPDYIAFVAAATTGDRVPRPASPTVVQRRYAR
jgi:peroxiredoxin